MAWSIRPIKLSLLSTSRSNSKSPSEVSRPPLKSTSTAFLLSRFNPERFWLRFVVAESLGFVVYEVS